MTLGWTKLNDCFRNYLWEMPKFIVLSLPINSGPSHSSVLTEPFQPSFSPSPIHEVETALSETNVFPKFMFISHHFYPTLASVTFDYGTLVFLLALTCFPLVAVLPLFLLLLYVCWWISYLYSGAILVWTLISPIDHRTFLVVPSFWSQNRPYLSNAPNTDFFPNLSLSWTTLYLFHQRNLLVPASKFTQNLSTFHHLHYYHPCPLSNIFRLDYYINSNPKQLILLNVK